MKLTKKELLEHVRAFIVDSGLGTPRGRRSLDDALVRDARLDDTFSLEWERGMGCSATIYIKTFEYNGKFAPLVEVNCPTTSRSPAQARAFVALLSRVTDLACTVEALLSGATIVEDDPAEKTPVTPAFLQDGSSLLEAAFKEVTYPKKGTTK